MERISFSLVTRSTHGKLLMSTRMLKVHVMIMTSNICRLECFVDEFKPRQYIIFDVGGTRFQGCKDNFVKYPKTRLGRLISSNSIEEILELCDEYTPGDPPEYFFDRNPENFPSVLEMYRSGKFHIPDSARCKHFKLLKQI